MMAGAYLRCTGDVQARDRFAYWRDVISDAYVPLDPTPHAGGCAFDGRIDGIALPELHSSLLAADSHRVRLAPAGVARRARSPFFVNLLLDGQARVEQDGAGAVARPGDVYVVDCASAWHVEFPERFRMFCVEIDERMLRPRLGRRGRLAGPVIDGSGGAGLVLARYLNLLRGLAPADLAPMQSLMSSHCTDLVARAQAGRETASAAERVRREMLERILVFIDRNLRDPSLSPGAACAALRISRSYLFKLLSEAGMTFAACVRERRLLAARRALARAPQTPVSAIAVEWGFGEASSFSRAYRARFGESPSATRSAAHEDAP